MTYHLLFVGTKFIYNKKLQEYVIRKVEKSVDFLSSITFFKENDSELFLYLEQELNTQKTLIVISTKQSFSTVGKLICTVTSDNLVFKDTTLIPQKSSLFDERSYLLEYKDCLVNAIFIDEMQKMPELLAYPKEETLVKVNIFNEDKESLELLLNPIAQMYDVMIEVICIIDEWMEVVIFSKKYGNISQFLNSAKQLLSSKMIASDDVVEHIIKSLAKHNKKISFAESCTGGLLTYYFTKKNGASVVFDGSLVTYSNELKENWLGIDVEVIQEHGAVSQNVVQEMSEGVMNVSHADFTISISGIAGDGGGSKEKPVGTVHIGVRTHDMHNEVHLQLHGDRNYIQHQSALYAIKMIVLSDKNIFF